MTRTRKKTLAVLMALSVVIPGGVAPTSEAAAKKVKLSKTKVSIQVGKTKKISIKNAKPFENSSLKTDTGDIEVDNVLNTKIISEADTGNEDVNGSDDSSGVTLTVTTDTGDIEVNDN